KCSGKVGGWFMIGKTVSHYKILEKLSSTEFIPSSSSGRRLSEVERLRTSCGGGNPAVAGQALPTDRDKSSRGYLLQEISK
ncbi:MAG: hypothetical protein V3U73_00005, partial [bacterium]